MVLRLIADNLKEVELHNLHTAPPGALAGRPPSRKALQTRVVPCANGRYARFKALGGNLLVTLGHSAAEPARPQHNSHSHPCDGRSVKTRG